jgi:hypothetical protein
MSQITLDVNSDIAGKINRYIRAFGSKDLLFERFIEFQKNSLRKEIARMRIDLDEFENKYNMASSDFFEKFNSGKIDDDRDFVVWSGIYEMFLENQQKLEQLS